MLSKLDTEVQDCDGKKGEFEVKTQMGFLYGSCVEFKYIEYSWELGHSKHKMGQKKEQCLRFILIVSSLFAYVAEFWT